MRKSHETYFREQEEAIDFLQTQQSRLMTTMERKNRVMKGTSEIQKKLFKEILNLEGEASGG